MRKIYLRLVPLAVVSYLLRRLQGGGLSSGCTREFLPRPDQFIDLVASRLDGLFWLSLRRTSALWCLTCSMNARSLGKT